MGGMYCRDLMSGTGTGTVNNDGSLDVTIYYTMLLKTSMSTVL